MPRADLLRLWPLRVLWVGVALLAGGPAADALDGAASAVSATAAVLAWTGWGAALAASAVPRTSSLTVVRTLVPAGLLASVAAVAAGDDLGAADLALLGMASLATVAAVAPRTTDAFVDGSSYGPERRLALRTPLAVLVVAVATWALTVVPLPAGLLLLADGRWLPGALVGGIGAATAVIGSRSLHQLSRRWLVLVPTGMVLHDPLTLPEPQLFLRQTMARLGPADPVAGADADAEDLTAGASGLVLELALSEPVDLLVRDGADAATRPVDRVWFTPTLPGTVLDEARRHRLPVS